MEADRITQRQQAILHAIIESYIETGEPIGSSTIVRLHSASGLSFSPATIRNEMAELAAQGFLEQPHTSAGRVPTARAFRLYVERLTGTPDTSDLADSARLRLRSRIESGLAGVSGTQALLERTSHILASVSSGVGVAVAAVEGADRLEHVHFSRIAPGRFLAVVVTQSGLVRDRVLSLESSTSRDLSVRELEAAAAFLNENFRGWDIERIRAEIGLTLERERAEYQALLASRESPDYIEHLWAGAIPNTPPVQTIYIEGVSNLLGSGSTVADLGRLREVLAALEAKERLVQLLNAYIDSRQSSVRVVFDLEEHAPELAGLVLIAAPARMAGEGRGTIGVLGTKRMHYGNTLNAVACVAELFERMLHPTA
ncbi:MAG: heat-inducible transcriptional repressor HrcA [Acidobacteriaceae bacterium]